MSRFARTPPKLANEYLKEESAVTPGPSRVRINQLHGQVSELVRKNQTLDASLSYLKRSTTANIYFQRKLISEATHYKLAIQTKDDEIKAIKDASRIVRKELEWFKKELEHCVSEGSSMRDQIQLHSGIQQQKALIALAQEQMRVVEIENQLLESDRARVLRDHKISLFQAREEELLADLEERDAKIDDLESDLAMMSSSLEAERNTAQSATSARPSSKELRQAQTEVLSARAEIASLQTKVESLESKTRALKSSEKEAKSELENWLREEGSVSSKQKEKTELRTQMRGLEFELGKRLEQVEELKEDLKKAKKDGKERERLPKDKLKDAQEKAERLQEEQEESRASAHKSGTGKRDKARKASPEDTESEDESPKKKAKKAVSVSKAPFPNAKPQSKAKRAAESSLASDSEADRPATKKVKALSKTQATPLEESDTDNKIKSSKVKVAGKNEGLEEDGTDISKDGDEKKKKKKRTLGIQPKPSFSWDHIMDSGDGVIPSYLSPAKGGGKPTGTIPRMGLSIPNRMKRFG
ncbi:hypothetical protein L198_03944 [Cryptococcus wingfieldii CBS 7118]|uniref:Uncharacterized protein n=1 Tax=Cryptococcus wingfieldii CBS 7118 TaxID=1295528 RepID=A0A1E3J927_9TREE|nr:hypothetical protein L198_03944 [Cryptococcus wingfieldii CBS 7118]ODN97380.1 hypothetical protein L198_03944 [Cryptococcus wingfieldii CBS 7118]